MRYYQYLEKKHELHFIFNNILRHIVFHIQYISLYILYKCFFRLLVLQGHFLEFSKKFRGAGGEGGGTAQWAGKRKFAKIQVSQIKEKSLNLENRIKM